MSNYLFFDSTSTTKCCDAAAKSVQYYCSEDYGNPSSNHLWGHKAARALREARHFFADTFKVSPEQVIFTGSGSEANNLAIYGITTHAFTLNPSQTKSTNSVKTLRVLTPPTEHPSVRKTVESLHDFGIETQWIPVDSSGQVIEDKYLELLTLNTKLVSIQQVNNIVGTRLPVEALAQIAKKQVPLTVFHTDAVQSFGKIDVPRFPSAIDLVSISGHKIEGPKGVGALIVLNKNMIPNQLRPLIWGGEQENGFRSGTQNVGLIVGFQIAAQRMLERQKNSFEHVRRLRERLHELLLSKKLLTPSPREGRVFWNSPAQAVPHIVSLSVPGLPAAPLAKLLEERHCLVSVGSACSSRKPQPDPVLNAMGFSADIQNSTIRVSLSEQIQPHDVETLVHALDDSIQLMGKLMGKRLKK